MSREAGYGKSHQIKNEIEFDFVVDSLWKFTEEVKKDPRNAKIEPGLVDGMGRREVKINKFILKAAKEIKGNLSKQYEKHMKEISSQNNYRRRRTRGFLSSMVGADRRTPRSEPRSGTTPTSSESRQGVQYDFDFEQFIKEKLHGLKQSLPSQFALSRHVTEIYLSGNISKQMFFERFQKLLENASNEWLIPFQNKKEGFMRATPDHVRKHVVIYLDLHDDENLFLLENLLFELLFMKVIRLKGFVVYLPVDTRFKFEIANSFTFCLLKKLQIFSLVPRCECSFDFDLKIFEFPRHDYNDFQIVCAFLKELHEGDAAFEEFRIERAGKPRWENLRVVHGRRLPKMKPNKMRRLIKGYFLDRAMRKNWNFVTFRHICDFTRMFARELIVANHSFHHGDEFTPAKRRRIIQCLYDTCFDLTRSFEDASDFQERTIRNYR